MDAATCPVVQRAVPLSLSSGVDPVRLHSAVGKWGVERGVLNTLVSLSPPGGCERCLSFLPLEIVFLLFSTTSRMRVSGKGPLGDICPVGCAEFTSCGFHSELLNSLSVFVKRQVTR